MSLSFTQISPVVMVAGAVGCLSYGTFVQRDPVSWKIPAVVSAWIWAFSIYTIAQEGVAPVWQNHSQSLWGNQVWFDLLYSVTLFWFMMLPRAKKVGMNIFPWFLYVCATASIGGLHMYSRILFLEEQEKYQGYTEQD